MKIAFISSLQNSWGGSEMMWYLTAKKAIETRQSVMISVYEQTEYHKNIIELQKTATLFQVRKNEIVISKKNIFSRIIYKLLKKRIENSIIKEIRKFNPERIVISLSNTYDFIWHKHIYLICNEFPEKIILQSNFHDEHYILTNEEIDKCSRLISQIDTIIFASHRNKQRFEHQMAQAIDNNKSIILRASTNYTVNQYTPIVLKENQPIVFCMMSRLNLKYKGQDIVLECFSEEKWKERNWILNLYGKGEDEEYLRKLIKFYRLEKHVFLKGYSDDLEKTWQENHILLMPSISEGTPIVLMIAMLCARPSIVTNVAGHSELIVEDKNGFIADGPNVYSFSRSLEKAWERRENWSRMGINSREIGLTILNLKPEEELYKLLNR